jgi:AraC family transcriptional regulator
LRVYDEFISNKSDYYAYSPSAIAQKMFFYPVCAGQFCYLPGYSIRRTSFDSFLLMYVSRGELTVEYGNKRAQAVAGEFVLIDCYQPHAYHSTVGWDSVWCHFDGPLARNYYEYIVLRMGNIFSLEHPETTVQRLRDIYQTFASGAVIKEAALSGQITDIMTQILLSDSKRGKMAESGSSMDEIVSYINEHFAENISIPRLAERAMLSQYHFIRVFKRETGFTPHEYIINTRISTAKYMLKNKHLSVKDVCYKTGFSSESVFCSCFKKRVGLTPAMYRISPSV